jgi:inorganic pyrophosphatase
LPPHSLLELRSFFEDYKKLENKEVIVEDFQNRDVAMEIIRKSILDYDEKFTKPKLERKAALK